MNLNRKIETAQSLIRRALMEARAPALMWSAGKDSMVLLHLLRTVRPELLPVLHHRDGRHGPAWHFADRIMAEWQLDIHDPPPVWRALKQRGSRIETVAGYDVGEGRLMLLPHNLFEGVRRDCGLRWLEKPAGQQAYPWDVLLHGHKSSDVDEYEGAVPLKADWVKTAGPTLVFPLRDWTDADIWDYTRREGVPQDEVRYARKDDRAVNNDWQDLCVRCLDRTAPAWVTCPKTNRPVPNRSDGVPRADAVALPEYIGKEN